MNSVDLIFPNFAFYGIIFLVIGIFLFAIFKTTIVITPNNHVYIIEQFGKYHSTRNAGLSFKLPLPIQKASHLVPLSIFDIRTVLSLKTKDDLFIQYPITVQLSVSNPVDSVYKLETPREQIISYISNLIRSEVGGKEFLELYNSRNDIEDVIKKELSDLITSFGFTIEAILVEEPIPSNEVQNAYNSVNASKRELEVSRNQAEAHKLRIIAEAEADKQAKKLRGEGIALQREAITKGFTESVETIANKMSISNELAVQTITILNKHDTMRDVASSSGTLLLMDTLASSDTNQILASQAATEALSKVNRK